MAGEVLVLEAAAAAWVVAMVMVRGHGGREMGVVRLWMLFWRRGRSRRTRQCCRAATTLVAALRQAIRRSLARVVAI